MKNKFLIFFLIVIVSPALYSQGFDWQYSARLPHASPEFFIGVSAEASYIKNNAQFNLLEYYVPCTTFNTGTGSNAEGGIHAEYWLDGLWALNSQLYYSAMASTFKKQDVEAALPQNKVTEYVLSTNYNYLSLEIGGKFRIPDSHFCLGAGLGFGFKLSQTSNVDENIISPTNYYFNTNPPSQIRHITQGTELNPVNIVNIIPYITAGYDFNLGLGTYATAYLKVSPSIISLTNTSDGSSWNYISYSFGISINRGLF